MIRQKPYGARNKQKLLELLFTALNCNCLAKDRHRELKLVSLEPPNTENSENVFEMHCRVCEQIGNAKCLRTIFAGGGGCDMYICP